jgi:ABC-2 type transport system permease protein
MFPRQAMPAFFQAVGLVLPLTHFLKVLRGILLKGVGLEALWREVAVLTGMSVVLIVASVRRFHKTLD